MARQVKRTRADIRIGGPGVPVAEFDRWWNATEEQRIAWRKEMGSDYEVDEVRLDEVMLTPGVSFNGEPPIIPHGVEVTKIGKIECRCGQTLGRILRVPPSDGRRPYYYAEVVLDGQVVARRIGRSIPLEAECPGNDGRMELSGKALLRLAMSAEERIAKGALSRVVTFRVPRRA